MLSNQNHYSLLQWEVVRNLKINLYLHTVPGIMLCVKYTEYFGIKPNPIAVKGCLIYKGEENKPLISYWREHWTGALTPLHIKVMQIGKLCYKCLNQEWVCFSCWNLSKIDWLFWFGQIVSHLRTKWPLIDMMHRSGWNLCGFSLNRPWVVK